MIVLSFYNQLVTPSELLTMNQRVLVFRLKCLPLRCHDFNKATSNVKIAARSNESHGQDCYLINIHSPIP